MVDMTSNPALFDSLEAIFSDITGTPSMTNKGLFEALMDPIPRIRISVAPPGCPDKEFT
ncbi:hypothetical protein D3C81_1315310 [compost metagenome]